MRKLTPTSSGSRNSDSDGRRGPARHGQADSKLVTLYQDTLEAPIPHDMLQLLERIGAEADDDR